MSTLICPFLQGECDFHCVFNNGCHRENNKENCNLLGATQVINSLQTENNQIDCRQNQILNALVNICSNTGSDQTDSYEIKGLLEDIKELLEKRC